MKRILALWTLVCGFLPLASAQPVGVRGELQLDQKEFLSGEDMQLRLLIENRSGQTIALGEGNDWISFTVTKEDDSLVAPLEAGEVADKFTVASARGKTLTFNLTPFFDFRAPGRYTVKAVFRIPQFHQDEIAKVSCAPVSFTVINGIRLNLPDMTVGVPPREGETNSAPVIRRYFLEKVTTAAEMKLYCQVTDASGVKTLRVIPICATTSFSLPEAQVDPFSDLHILNQSGSQSFTYVEVDTHGFILERRTYDYAADSRPRLQNDAKGRIIVSGGVRRVSPSDIPPGSEASTAAASGTDPAPPR